MSHDAIPTTACNFPAGLGESAEHWHMCEDLHANQEAIAELAALVRELVTKVGALAEKIDGLEAEFAPLARKYGRLAGAAAALPGAGWSRRNLPRGGN